MKIQINTDDNIASSDAFEESVRTELESELGHLVSHITRVEMHLSDENSEKGGANDKRCLIEARAEGRQPIAVTHEAATVSQAIGGATEKLKRAMERIVDRSQKH